MKLIELAELTDTDLAEIMDREIPCSTRAMNDGKPWRRCTDVAEFWLKATCRKCGHSERILTCPPCTEEFGRFARFVAPFLAFHKGLKHSQCRRPIFIRFTQGRL